MALIAAVAEALLAGRMPPRDAAMFVDSALSAWLSGGGNLEKQYLRVSAKAGSHATASALWRALRDASSRGEQDADDPGSVEPMSTTTWDHE